MATVAPILGRQIVSKTATSVSSYLKFIISYQYSQDPITNKTTLTFYGYLDYTDKNITYYHVESGSTTSFKINGTTIFNGHYDIPKGNRIEIGHTTKVVTHNASGVFPNTSVSYYASSTHWSTPLDSTFSLTSSAIPNIDRNAPTFTIVPSNITSTSVTLTINTSELCDRWEYSINNGSTYTQFSTAEKTEITQMITGLTPDETYQIKIRARRKSNQVVGTSSALSVTMLGSTKLNNVSVLTIDGTSPVLTFNWSVYNSSYYHKLEIKIDGSTIVTITGLRGNEAVGVNKTYSLTSTQQNNLLSAMSSATSVTATYVLTTYSRSTYSSTYQIGEPSTVTGVLHTSPGYSAPVINSITYLDSNSATRAITGNQSLMMQNYSTISVTIDANAQNRASIESYTVTIGEKSVTSVTSTVNFGTISESGLLRMIVTVTDTRGYLAKRIINNVSVIAYEDVTFDTWTATRVNSVENDIILQFGGSFSPVAVSGTDKNTLQSLSYRYKLTSSTSWSSYVNIPLTDSHLDISSGSFEYLSSGVLSLPESYSYNVEIKVTDKLSNNTILLTVNKGRPLVAFRDEMVGINNNTPTCALDVGGNIKMNSYNVMGVIKDSIETGTDLNNLLDEGLYFQRSVPGDNLNYPILTFGMLEVFSVSSNLVTQRFTQRDPPYRTFVRTKINSTWGNWREIWNGIDEYTFTAANGITITRQYLTKTANICTLYCVGTISSAFSKGTDHHIGTISTAITPEYSVSTCGICKTYDSMTAWVSGQKTLSGAVHANASKVYIRPSVDMVSGNAFEFTLVWNNDVTWN